MNNRKAICIYCASSANISPTYISAANLVGMYVAESGRVLVCGAGKSGLMGATTEAAIKAGGEVIGVIPRFMVDNGWHHPHIDTLEITDSMHTRKQRMAELADGVIALPGGCGTMEELLEIITWKQLGLYHGNIVILNTDGYYDPLIKMLERAVEQHFMSDDHRKLWTVANTPKEAVGAACREAAETKISSKYQ